MISRPLDFAHRLKEFVLRSESLRRALRTLVVTPYQKVLFRRLLRLLPQPDEATGPTILVVAFRHWALSRAWELTLTRQLQSQGTRVVWMHCDRTMTRCDSMLTKKVESKLCRHCISFNRDLTGMADIEVVSLADYLDDVPSPADEAREHEVVTASLQRVLGARPSHTPNASERKIRAEMQRSAAAVRAAGAKLLDNVRPNAVIALNGKFFGERIILELAQSRGAQIWTYERGNREGTIVVSPSLVAVPFDTTDVRNRLDEPLTQRQNAQLDAYLVQRAKVGNGQISFAPVNPRRPAHVADSDSRVISAFTNLVWDSAVAGEDTIFDDMFDWLITTVRAVAEDTTIELVIRVHPAETRVYWHPTRERVDDVVAKTFPERLPSNVRIIGPDDPIDSYDLMRNSNQVLVYTSTVGLEAAVMGTPVLVAAHSNYSNTPFVTTPKSREEYVQRLTAEQPPDLPSPEMVGMARRFMYRLYFEKMIPMPFVVEDPTGFHLSAHHAQGKDLQNLSERILKTARRNVS